jgi:hypothetical protein
MTKTITQSDAARMIRESGGKLFSVTFTKRGNGALRRMTARTGVRKGVTGDGLRFNPHDHYLLTVHEFVTHPERGERGRLRNMGTQFRSVPVDGIVELRIGGQTFNVVPASVRSAPSPF